MDVDQEPQGQTPPGSPFNDGYTTTTNRGASSADPPVGVHTGNFYTPLYTESQEIGHTNVNTIQQTPQPMRTYLEAIRDAELAAATAAASAEAKASSKTTFAKAEAIEAAAAEAAAEAAAKSKANLAAAAEATSVAKAAAVATSEETEVTTATSTAWARTAEAVATALSGDAASEATNPNNSNHTAQQTGAVPLF